MTSKINFVWVLFGLALITITIQSCKKDEPAEGIDLELLSMSESLNGFTWFKNSDAWLPASTGTGHAYTSLRTRYNTIAATQLDNDGKVLSNASFAEGSLIVKELSSSTTVERYAILFKQSDSDHADSNGWVWGYINADGTVATSAEDKGAICTSCHLQPDNIDYMLMNKFFP